MSTAEVHFTAENLDIGIEEIINQKFKI